MAQAQIHFLAPALSNHMSMGRVTFVKSHVNESCQLWISHVTCESFMSQAQMHFLALALSAAFQKGKALLFHELDWV